MKKTVSSIILAATLLAIVVPAHAQSDADKGKAVISELDLSVPESPAFTVLGVAPETVTRPTNPRALATSLLNGLDKNGKLQNGLAIDYAPFLKSNTYKRLGLFDYQRNTRYQILSRTQVSFGTIKGASGDDTAQRIALGFHSTLIDQRDPRMDKEFLSNIEPVLNPFLTFGPDSENEATERLKKAEEDLKSANVADRDAAQQGVNNAKTNLRVISYFLNKYKIAQDARNKAQDAVTKAKTDHGEKSSEYKKATVALENVQADFNAIDQYIRASENLTKASTDAEKKEAAKAYQDAGQKYYTWALDTHEKRARRGTTWLIGLAPTWINNSTDGNKLKWYGAGYWTSLGYGFSNTNQFIIHARYRSGEKKEDSQNTGQFFSQDSSLFGIRYRASNSKETEAISFEAARIRTIADGQPSDNYTLYSVDLENKVADNLWLAFSFGTTSGRRETNNLTFQTGLKWGFSGKSQLKQPSGK